MRSADVLQGRLLGHALGSIGKDLPSLVAGSELSEVGFDVALWATEGEQDAQQQIEAAAREFGRKLKELGWRGVVFAASNTYLAETDAD